ncbi:MAG: hypothetical protein QM690_16050 [Sphingobium sp.]
MAARTSEQACRTRWVIPSLVRALLITGALLAIPFFIARYIADMTGDRR